MLRQSLYSNKCRIVILMSNAMKNLRAMQSFRRANGENMIFEQKKTQKVSFRLTFWAKDAYASKSKQSISYYLGSHSAGALAIKSFSIL